MGHHDSDSAILHQRSCQRVPGGVNSNIRLDGPRVFFERGQGAWLWDVDGNDYVDYLLGQGPAFLGHAPPTVLDAVEHACRRGMVYAAQHPLEIEAAERVCEVAGWPERVRLGSSGTEMVQLALRVARAATGRRRFVRFEGHYHGWLDNVLMSFEPEQGPASAGQTPSALDDCLVVAWNDLPGLRDTLEQQAGEVAAVLMEPIMLNAGAIPPAPGYLEGVRQLCDEHGIVLIFDEIISGFRLRPGGAAERFGVTPDLATYGKAMAGGWPAAALAGRADLMERIGSGEVNHSGTFNGNVMAAAATMAALEYLRDEDPYERVEQVGKALMCGLSELGKSLSPPLRVQGLPAAFHAFFFGDADEARSYSDLSRFDQSRYRRLAAALLEHGIWVSRRGIWYVSVAHTEKEVDVTLDRARKALAHM